MSLDLAKLKNVRRMSARITARCPACAEAGGDRTGDHLLIRADGRFGCVVYSGDSADAKEHRKRIFTLCGDREIKPLAVRSADLGRLGRVNQSHSAETPLKTGLLGRLGRAFESHSEPEGESNRDEPHNADPNQRNDSGKDVLGVLSGPTPTPQRPLSEHERAVLIEWCGTENHPLILEARDLFNATIIEIVPTAAFSPVKRQAANGLDQLNGAGQGCPG
jgi:hypothetical protein